MSKLQLPKHALTVDVFQSHLDEHPEEFAVVIEADGDAVAVSDCRPVFITGAGYEFEISEAHSPNAVFLVAGRSGSTVSSLREKLHGFPKDFPVVITAYDEAYVAPVTCSQPVCVEVDSNGYLELKFGQKSNTVMFSSSDDDD